MPQVAARKGPHATDGVARRMNRSAAALSRSSLEAEAPLNISASRPFGSNRNPASMAGIVRARGIPKEFDHSAQGCELASYPENTPAKANNPEGVASTSGHEGCNPFRVADLVGGHSPRVAPRCGPTLG